MTHPTPAQLRAELARELYEERAAILEYMAGYTRAEAERVALDMYAHHKEKQADNESSNRS